MTDPSTYVTTPIFYVNDAPHIGHCYTATLADVYARFMRLAGREVLFLTGTDEHADKVVTSATAHGVSPQAWADTNAAAFREAFGFLNIACDDFIRTTESRHTTRVSRYIAALQAAGAVYKGEYTGWYDPGQEEYLTETSAKEAGYVSPVSGKSLIRRTETCYFFRLSKYQAALEARIDAHPEFLQPESRRNEVRGRLREGLQDVPISRPVTDDPATQWGIRMPGDPSHRVYVWIDALFNYLSTIDTPDRRHFWPPTCHLIGKDILWFHAVIWPCLLMALNEPLPRTIYAHGWWISEGRKMSKSLGNFIDLAQLRRYVEGYGVDALRWFLVTQGPLGAADADFSHAKFTEIYSAELVNTVGNCASRVTAMIGKYCDGLVPQPSSAAAVETGAGTLAGAAAQATGESIRRMDAFDLAGSLQAGLALVRRVDGHINATEPFKLAKDPRNAPRLAAILYDCAETVRIASLLLWAAMPGKMAELWRALGLAIDPAAGELVRLAAWGGLVPGTQVNKVALFPRVEPQVDSTPPAPPAPTDRTTVAVRR
jgi:methionyl-tRNA synthetase